MLNLKKTKVFILRAQYTNYVPGAFFEKQGYPMNFEKPQGYLMKKPLVKIINMNEKFHYF